MTENKLREKLELRANLTTDDGKKYAYGDPKTEEF